ncbi:MULTISPECIES: NlpC/P60 family protein [Streptomyces]|uniref:C40 family peptidase n=2 Tax=Streptomyces TaxID=1883 RepID=UPI001FD7445A|nr:bifunctional lytic transglycosylase/C40 family peptidase [Streptomyces griseolus]
MNTIVKGALLTITGAMVVVLVLVAGLLSTEADTTDDQGGGLHGVPQEYAPWIRRAVAACQHSELAPALMAAQIKQESGFRAEAGSHAGAQGPAQFVPGTWAVWGRDSDGNGRADPHDVGDAVIAQGRFMCSLLGSAKTSGFRDDPRRLALAGYNAGWGAVQRFGGVPPLTFANGETYNYVRIIMASMKKYATTPDALSVAGSGTGPDALRRAARYIGTPYSYGGGTPKGPGLGFCDRANGYAGGRCVASSTTGFDCSSLVQYGYWPTVQLPRTAAAQYNATSRRPVARGALKPGDLVFWSNRSGAIYHVGLYAGQSRILHAPKTGRDIRVEPIDTAMPAADYHGATRP